MKPKRRWNERTRLILTLELAVVLPAAALVIVSVWHLNQIRRDRAVEAAIQRDFTQVLHISEKQMNYNAFALADDVRNDFPMPGEGCAYNLDRILSSHPYLAHVFLFDLDKGLVVRSQPYRMKEDASFRTEASELTKMTEGWLSVDYKDVSEKIIHTEKKGVPPYYVYPYWVPRPEKKAYQVLVMFLKKDKSTAEATIGGMVFDADYLKGHFFPDALQSVISRN